jgi:predicted dehydrogenase
VREGDITIPKVPGGEPLKSECEHFLDCVANGKKPLVGGREAGAVVRTLEAIDRSMKAGGGEEKVV